jgi:hypothetical protein
VRSRWPSRAGADRHARRHADPGGVQSGRSGGSSQRSGSPRLRALVTGLSRGASGRVRQVGRRRPSARSRRPIGPTSPRGLHAPARLVVPSSASARLGPSASTFGPCVSNSSSGTSTTAMLLGEQAEQPDGRERGWASARSRSSRDRNDIRCMTSASPFQWGGRRRAGRRLERPPERLDRGVARAVADPTSRVASSAIRCPALATAGAAISPATGTPADSSTGARAVGSVRLASLPGRRSTAPSRPTSTGS